MPLATKNNAIILKDGKLAEGCGCCGGWYCYQDSQFSDPQYAMASIQTASVTISAQDYIKWSSHTFYYGPEYRSEGFAGAQHNGTFALTKSGNTWRYDFSEQPDATCVSYLLLSLAGTQWTLRFAYSKMMHSSFTQETYKQLSEMQCRDSYDYIYGFQFQNGPTRFKDITGGVDSCQKLIGLPSALPFLAFEPNVSSPGHTIVRQDGSLSVSISLSVSY
jgi:hypothetical protein